MSRSLIAQELINLQDRHVMRRTGTRHKFGMDLCAALDFWSVEEMINFVHEMSGLSFVHDADRKMFFDFLNKWMHLEDVR